MCILARSLKEAVFVWLVGFYSCFEVRRVFVLR